MQRQQFERLRHGILALHKAIVDDTRAEVEREEGRIAPHRFVERLMIDPAFAWLRPLSAAIVAMDEWLDAREGEPVIAAAIAAELRVLLAPAPDGDGFQRRYADLMQRSPDIILAHATAVRLLGR